MLREIVLKLLEEALDENPSLFLIDFQIDENQNIKVVIDGDQGVTVNECITISRAIEHHIDRDQFDFALEVASAGASSPLLKKRQYKKHIGRVLMLKTTAGETLEGSLVEVTDDTLKINWKTREPKPVGKGKITVEKSSTLAFEEIKECKVKLIFN